MSFHIFHTLRATAAGQRSTGGYDGVSDHLENLSVSVIKILTHCRIHKMIFKKYHVKALDQSFPMMYIKGGSTFGRSQSKRGFSPKNCLKNSFSGGHETGSTDFGGGWDPQF